MADVNLDGIDFENLFLISDAGITGDENSHSTFWLLSKFVSLSGFPNHPLDIVRIDHPNVFDATSFNQFFKRERFTRMAVCRGPGFGSGLHACHGCNGIIKDHENKTSTIINSIQESRSSGVIES